jgi:glycosyltransferase involved in cell wall biosynthesis
MTDDAGGVLFVIPGPPGRSAAVDAPWLAGASFARALGNKLGGVDLLTTQGLIEPDAAIDGSVRASAHPSAARGAVRTLPRPARVAVGDVRIWREGRRMRALAADAARNDYRLVVQLHRRFHDCGLHVARRAAAPFVLRVEALEVREGAGWGLSRPLWGRLAERRGEMNIIRRADLVASVSEEVDSQLAEAGIPADKRVVIPNGVDLESFSPGDRDVSLLEEHGLEGRFVVGWVGGFRPFHGLEIVARVARELRDRVPEAVLCLVGAGPLWPDVESSVRGLDNVRLVPAVAHTDVARWIRSFDACLLLAGRGGFHYSPMKLYEYLACGRPVVAARAGEMGRVLKEGRDALLVEPDDAEEVVSAVERLATNAQLRKDLGGSARITAERTASWDGRAAALLERAQMLDLVEGPSEPDSEPLRSSPPARTQRHGAVR